MRTKIKGLDGLKEEKSRLRIQKAEHETALKNDIQFIKKEYLSAGLLSKAVASIVPESIRHSKIINAPINFIGKIFGKEDVVHTTEDSGKGDTIRNTILAVAQSAAPLLIRTLLGRRKK